MFSKSERACVHTLMNVCRCGVCKTYLHVSMQVCVCGCLYSKILKITYASIFYRMYTDHMSARVCTHTCIHACVIVSSSSFFTP